MNNDGPVSRKPNDRPTMGTRIKQRDSWFFFRRRRRDLHSSSGSNICRSQRPRMIVHGAIVSPFWQFPYWQFMNDLPRTQSISSSVSTNRVLGMSSSTLAVRLHELTDYSHLKESFLFVRTFPAGATGSVPGKRP